MIERSYIIHIIYFYSIRYSDENSKSRNQKDYQIVRHEL